VLFITCGLSDGAFEKLVDFLLSTDDGIGAVQTRVHQMMKERGMIDSNDPVVMEQRQQIYERISQTRTTEFMAMALMHPSKSLRELALSELREYRMDSLSIANAILLQVNGGSSGAGGAGGSGERGPQSNCCKAAGLDSVGLLKYDSDTKKGPQHEKADIVAQLVRVWTDSETHDGSLRSEAGTAIAALKAHAFPVVRAALCAQLQDTGQSGNSITEALSNIQIFVLTEAEARGADTETDGHNKTDVVAAVLGLLSSKSFARAACNTICALASLQHRSHSEVGWMAPAIATIKRLFETNPQQALLALASMVARRKQFSSEYASDFAPLVIRYLQPEVDQAVQLQAVQTAIAFAAEQQIRDCLLSLASEGSYEVKLQIVRVLPALMSYEVDSAGALVLSIARDESAALELRKAALDVAKTIVAAESGQNNLTKEGRPLLTRQRSVLTKVQAAGLVTELEAEWCADDKLAADWLQAMLRTWEPEQAVLKMVSVLQSGGPIRTTGVMMCDPNFWGSFLCDGRIHAALVSIAANADCERSVRMGVFPQLVRQIEAASNAESVLPRERLICILTDGATENSRSSLSWCGNPVVQQEAILKFSGLLLKGSWGSHEDLSNVIEGLVTNEAGSPRTQLRALALLPLLDRAVGLRILQELLEKLYKPVAALWEEGGAPTDAATEGAGAKEAGAEGSAADKGSSEQFQEKREEDRLLRRDVIKLACSSKHNYYEAHKIRTALVRAMVDSRYEDNQCQVLDLMAANFDRAIVEEVRAIQAILEGSSVGHKVRVAAVAALKMLTPEQLQQPHTLEKQGAGSRDLISTFVSRLEEGAAQLHETVSGGVEEWRERTRRRNSYSFLKVAIEATAHQELLMTDPRVCKIFLALAKQLSSKLKKKGMRIVQQALLAPIGKMATWLQANGKMKSEEIIRGRVVVAIDEGKEEEEEENEVKERGKAEEGSAGGDVVCCFLEIATTLAADEDETIAKKAQAMLTDFGRHAAVGSKSTSVAVLHMLDMLADSKAAPFLFEPLLSYFRRQRDAHFEERANQPHHGDGVQGQTDQEAGWVLGVCSSSKLEAHLPSKDGEGSKPEAAKDGAEVGGSEKNGQTKRGKRSGLRGDFSRKGYESGQVHGRHDSLLEG
jgi:hypothetical protein